MNIFIAFANQDREVRDKLLRQMNLIKDRQGFRLAWCSPLAALASFDQAHGGVSNHAGYVCCRQNPLSK